MIRVGAGGWTFEPWRGSFFPAGLPHARELHFASRNLTSIEVNGTFYRTQTPASFRRWADESPDGFVFALKAPRYATNRKVLAEAGSSIERFVQSGLTELGPKLGPINWQLPPTKRFEEEDLAAFLALLPRAVGGYGLRHALEVRHPSFRTESFVRLMRRHQVAIVLADSDDYPSIPDATADFIYARLQRSTEAEPTGYGAAALDSWASRFAAFRAGGAPDDLEPVSAEPAAPSSGRDVFVYMISGAKVRAPAAARALIERLS